MKMKQLIILLFSLLITTHVSSKPDGYDFMGETISGDVHWGNFSSIRKDGNKVRMWSIMNMSDFDDGIKSFRALKEFDCKNETEQSLSVHAFSDFDARGESTDISDLVISKINYLAPNTMSYKVMNIACKHVSN